MTDKNTDNGESCQGRGPYYLVYGSTPEELEANVNELLREWPLPYWAFLGYWRDQECYYRELLKLPRPESSSLDASSWITMGLGGGNYDA
jgi:hypothetical protein